MRILIMSNAYTPTLSGVVTSIRIYKKALTAAGHEVFVFAPAYKGVLDDEMGVFRFPALDVTRIVDFSLLLAGRKRIVAAARVLKPDIVHSQHPSIMGDRAVDVARALGIPLVATFHCRYDEYAETYSALLSPLVGGITRASVRKYAGKCDRIVLPGANMRAWLAGLHPGDVPVSVVPIPLELDRFARPAGGNVLEKEFGLKKEQVMLYVGRLSTEKNVTFLIRMLPHVLAGKPEARLVVVGKGPLRAAMGRLAQQLGVEKAVVFAGPRPFEEIPSLLHSAGVFVFSSLIENQPLGVIEACAAGLPVVALDSPATREVLETGGGILAANDPKRFADEVVDLMGDPGRLRAMSRQAEKSAGRYAVPALVKKLLDTYTQTQKDFKN
jgi:1,2-diacylglycerol 3-alpha-glucosyltransferase